MDTATFSNEYKNNLWHPGKKYEDMKDETNSLRL